MGLFALFIFLLIGPYFLIFGSAPLPIFYGHSNQKAWLHNISALMIRIMGACFTLAGLLPIFFSRGHDGWWFSVSIWLSIGGFVILGIGLLRGLNGPRL